MIYSLLQLCAQGWSQKRSTTCTFLSSARAAFRSVTDTDFSPSGVADIARGMGESRPPTESVSLRRAHALWSRLTTMEMVASKSRMYVS
jgi:hypothetical protein